MSAAALPAGVRRTVPTWEMTREELARLVAAHFGYTTTVRDAGWIRRPDGAPVCQGWTALAELLERRGIIAVGRGINWSQVRGELRIPRYQRGGR